MKAIVGRYLGATRNSLEIIPPSEQFDQWVARVLSSCFPLLQLDLIPIRVRSADLVTEFFEADGERYLLFDQELAETLAELDYITAASLPDLYSYIKLHLLLSDSFRKSGNMKLAQFYMAKAFSQRRLLKQLRATTIKTAGFSIAGTVVLLHELTHLALADGARYRNDWFTFIKKTIGSFGSQMSAIVETRDLNRLEALTGLPSDYINESNFFSQFAEMMTAFHANKTLHEEVACDLFAALTFINLKAPVSFLETIEHATIPLSLRELGDTFYKVVVVISNMQLLSAVRQTTVNITFEQRSETIGKGLSELTLRHNVLIYALTLVYRHFLTHATFGEEPGDPFAKLGQEEKEGLFLKSVKHYIAKRDRLFLQPFSQIVTLLYNPEDLNKAFIDEYGLSYAHCPGGYDWKPYDEARKAFYRD